MNYGYVDTVQRSWAWIKLRRRPGTLHGYDLCRGLVVAALFYAILYHPYADEQWPAKALHGYLEWTARSTALLLRWMGQTPTVAGDVVSGSFAMRVVLDCAALDVLALVSAAIIAVPSTLKHKMIGLVAAWIGLIVANLLRLVALYWVGYLAPAWFDWMHEEVLALAMVVATLVVFTLWLQWVRCDRIRKEENAGSGQNVDPERV